MADYYSLYCQFFFFVTLEVTNVLLIYCQYDASLELSKQGFVSVPGFLVQVLLLLTLFTLNLLLPLLFLFVAVPFVLMDRFESII